MGTNLHNFSLVLGRCVLPPREIPALPGKSVVTIDRMGGRVEVGEIFPGYDENQNIKYDAFSRFTGERVGFHTKSAAKFWLKTSGRLHVS